MCPQNIFKIFFNLSKINGYNSCPFDLCITSEESLYKTLATNFNDFFDDLKIIPGSNAKGNRENAGPGLTNITNKNGIIFNHEGAGCSHLFKNGKDDDLFYTRNNFNEFKKRYSSRILNFKNYCRNFDEIIFIHNHKNLNEDIIKNLIIKFYRKKNIKFISLVKN